MTKIMGIDEAGRGPVLGDLFVAGVIFSENNLKIIEDSEVNDSKKLSPAKREQLYQFVTQKCISYQVERITNFEIDENRKNEVSLNDLELNSIANLIVSLNPDVVYIDALGKDLDKFRERLISRIKKKLNSIPKIITEHKADETYKIVGAASIIAKIERDHSISENNAIYVDYDIGSGYPSDEKTIEFLRQYISLHKKPPKITRTSWKTCKNLMNELVYQKKIDNYF